MADTQQEELDVQLNLTQAQAQAMTDALDFFVRLGIGQVEEVAEKMRDNTLPMFRPSARVGKRQPVPGKTLDEVEARLNDIKALLGYPTNGSHGIGHTDNHVSVTRCYELLKVTKQSLAVARNPAPTFRGVDYDGLIVRYTDDAAPECRVLTAT